jgi:probable O-glycosylation ligase (exosortase A-associated)
MPLRDIVVTVFILGLLPFVFTRPHWGIYLWTWIGIMSPHKLTWGFARNMQFALVVALVTLVATLASKERKSLPVLPCVLVLLAFDLWMTVTTVFALYPGDAWPLWEKVMKIQLFIFITMMMMQTRARIEGLVWVGALSLAFFGIKGGIYTLAGGSGHVLGPPGTFISGNTEISLAMTMGVPLLFYLVNQATHRWIRWSLWGAMALTSVAVLGSFSRGGMLAIAGMAAFLWLKSRRKLALAIAGIVLIPAVLTVLPERWFEKMATIKTYEQDASAMGRINAWGFAVNLAKARPLVGGGFGTFKEDLFRAYAPNPTDFHDAHSIWFEVLGEQGFVGLALYALLWFLAWRTASGVIGAVKGRADLKWASDLSAMLQVSLVGYFIGGTFLGLAYWDVPYLLLALIVLTKTVTDRELLAATSLAGSSESSALPVAATRAQP